MRPSAGIRVGCGCWFIWALDADKNLQHPGSPLAPLMAHVGHLLRATAVLLLMLALTLVLVAHLAATLLLSHCCCLHDAADLLTVTAIGVPAWMPRIAHAGVQKRRWLRSCAGRNYKLLLRITHIAA